MKKSYFVDGAMALALACTLVGCSKEDLSSGEVSTNSSIDAASDQNWQMLNTGKVNIGINKDANAPIFNVCKYGIVGDAKQVLAKALEQLKK